MPTAPALTLKGNNMNSIQNLKFVAITPPAAISDNASPTTAELDCAGWDSLLIVVHFGAMDIAVATLKVTESDTPGSGHADVTGLVYGTSTNTDGNTSTLPSATADNTFVAFEIDLRKRKRYIDVTYTTGDGSAGTYSTIFGVLSRGDTTPSTAAGRGFGQVLRV